MTGQAHDPKPGASAPPASEKSTDDLESPTAGPVRLHYCGLTDVGLVRDHNEDNLLLLDLTDSRQDPSGESHSVELGPRGRVFAVCDGMGGAAAGEVASQMAADTLREELAAKRDVPKEASENEEDVFACRLVMAIEEAGTRIFSAAHADRARRGMGTTATVAGVIGRKLFVGQVGDSRAYVLREGQMTLITKDQSLVNQLIEAGQLTSEEAEAFEHSNIILQALGTTNGVAVDLTFLELRRGDRLLLCSDGLSGMVHPQTMQETLVSEETPLACCRKLIELACAGGGHDNVTAVVVDFDGEGLTEPEGVGVAYQQYPLPYVSPRIHGDDEDDLGEDFEATTASGAIQLPAGQAPPHRSFSWRLITVVLLAAAGVWFTLSSHESGREATEPTTRATASARLEQHSFDEIAVDDRVGGEARSDGQDLESVDVTEAPGEAAPAPRTADLRVPVFVRTPLPAATLFVDGENVGPLMQGESVELALPPGRHRLEAQASGRTVAVRSVLLRPGTRMDVTLSRPPTRTPARPATNGANPTQSVGKRESAEALADPNDVENKENDDPTPQADQ